MKHQPYRKNNGFWSCRVCQWQWNTYPNKNDCPNVKRIEHATDEYKTEKQWRKLGFEVIHPDDWDAISIVHGTKRYLYYHRDHVRGLTPLAPDKSGDSLTEAALSAPTHSPAQGG